MELLDISVSKQKKSKRGNRKIASHLRKKRKLNPDQLQGYGIFKNPSSFGTGRVEVPAQ